MGDASTFGPSMKAHPTSLAHGLDPGIDAAPVAPSGGHQIAVICRVPVAVAQRQPNQRVQLIV
jgi:hypothetical protein